MGVFITFEGVDGCGKSTQIELLDRELKKGGISTCVTREPGGTEAGDSIRKILLAPGRNLDTYAQLFLFMADRVQHLQEVIRPALKEGRWVLCDRFVESTLVYQGYGLGVNLNFIEYLHEEIIENTWPDITIILDCPVGIARERLRARSGIISDHVTGVAHDRYEGASQEFQNRLRKGYVDLANRSPERIRLIDGTADPEEVHYKVVVELKKKNLWPLEK